VGRDGGVDIPLMFLDKIEVDRWGHLDDAKHKYDAPEFAEGDQTPIVYDFIKSSDGVALATAVSQIKNKAVRRQILELARSLAKDHEGEE